MSRADARLRRIVNEDELIDRLSRHGFAVVRPGEYSAAEQAQIFSRARVIVGAHGNGLTNIVFAPQGATVIELFGSNFVHGAFAWLAHLRNLNYHYVICDRRGSDSTQNFHVSAKTIGECCERFP